VIYPERDMAQRTAVKYSIANAFEYYELTPEYAILEIAVPGKLGWQEYTVVECAHRSSYQYHRRKTQRSNDANNQSRLRFYSRGAFGGCRQ